ncbi:hypothetical protein WMY93_023979 [Mugilogobius chulae]|uniref:Uncharacterized protein n=1 Tax=Mugilogobius chulae TaxID=88201 RepID=A0AAW0N6X3_9GOBI
MCASVGSHVPAATAAVLPLALVGFILWAPLQAVRQPYLYTYIKLDRSLAEEGQAGPGGLSDWKPQGRSFCFCSANVCLLPDSLARFNNLSDTHRRAREVGKRIRNGANRPQIKIYIDSPTNTSISAASFSSLATGFRRTSSLDQRPEQSHSNSGPADSETEPLTECPLHSSSAVDCPAHPTVEQAPSPCPLHHKGTESAPDCPLHSSDCPVHNGGSAPDCPLHQASGAQNNSPDHQNCPMHSSKESEHKCPLHSPAGAENDCPIHCSTGEHTCPCILLQRNALAPCILLQGQIRIVPCIPPLEVILIVPCILPQKVTITAPCILLPG